MGHRLTIAMKRWQATVNWDQAGTRRGRACGRDGFAAGAARRGGVKGLSGPEKALVRSNALKVAGRRPISRNPIHRGRYRENRRRVSPQRETADPRQVARARNRSAHRGSRRLVADVRPIHGAPIRLRRQALLAADGFVAGRRRRNRVVHRRSRQRRLTARFTAGAEPAAALNHRSRSVCGQALASSTAEGRSGRACLIP